ncbi:MAG TPA: polysaccharide biosynthesis C-terminal domain-containing protein, partial [Ferruginibacter sp.]|nr:polysaccharide biosynthesis C-terminal domain-containing protein [Ferruginibacter sp.]
ARHFEAAISGSIYYIINIYAFIHLVSSLSMESGIIYFGSKKEIETSKLFNFSVLWTFLIGIILWILMTTVIDFSYQNISRSLLITSGLTFICGNLLYNYSAGLFYAQQNFMIPNVISLFFNMLLVIILPYHAFTLFPAITADNYFYFYFFSFIAQGLCTVIAFKILYQKQINLHLPSNAEFKKLFQFSLLALSGNIVFFLLYRIDYWFVEKYCSGIELGNYIQVSKLGQLFFLLPSILATAIFPLTASDKKESIYKGLALVSRLFLFFYTIVCLILIFIGHWFFPFIFGDTYTSMHVAFIYLVPGILALSTLYTLTAYNGGRNKQKVNIVGCVLALIVVVAGNFLFVPQYGINAAAAVSSIGYIVFQAYLLYDFKKEYSIKLSSFFIFRLDDINTLKKIMKLGN